MNLFSRCLGSPLSRRNFLHVGAIGALGLTLDRIPSPAIGAGR